MSLDVGDLVLLPRHPFNGGQPGETHGIVMAFLPPYKGIMVGCVLSIKTEAGGRSWRAEVWTELGRMEMPFELLLDPVTFKTLVPGGVSSSDWANLLQKSIDDGFIDRAAVQVAAMMW